MTLDTGSLENGLKRVEQFQTISKDFERKYRIRHGKSTQFVRDATGIFRTNISITNGPDITLGDKEALPTEVWYTNANNKFFGCLTFGNNWTWNYPTNFTALSLTTEDSDIFVKDGNSYTTFLVRSFNLPSSINTNVEFYIVDDSNTEHLVGWNNTITIPATSSAFFRLKNVSGGDIVYDMYNSTGQPVTFDIEYS